MMNSQPGKNIEIREVTGKKALKTFIRVPWAIYKDDPNWVPPLLMERKEALSSKHPFYQAKEPGLIVISLLVELIDLGPSFFRPVTKLTLALLIFLHGLIPNYGWVIILLSVATKFLFYPLTKISTRSMREMQLVQPELAKLKEKYKV